MHPEWASAVSTGRGREERREREETLTEGFFLSGKAQSKNSSPTARPTFENTLTSWATSWIKETHRCYKNFLGYEKNNTGYKTHKISFQNGTTLEAIQGYRLPSERWTKLPMVTKFTWVKDRSEDTFYLPGLSATLSFHSKVVTFRRCQNILLEF